MSKYTPTAPETAELEKLLAEATPLQITLYAAQAEITRLRAENEALKDGQTYCYIGKDGKAVLARDLEDERDALRAEVATLRASEARMREALNPSGDTKAAYMGEFSVPLPDTDEDGNEVMRQINVPWTTIKQIMAAISARAALQGETK